MTFNGHLNLNEISLTICYYVCFQMEIINIVESSKRRREFYVSAILSLRWSVPYAACYRECEVNRKLLTFFLHSSDSWKSGRERDDDDKSQ